MYQLKYQKSNAVLASDLIRFVVKLDSNTSIILADVTPSRKIPLVHTTDQLLTAPDEGLTKTVIAGKIDAAAPGLVVDFVPSIQDGVYHDLNWIACDTNDLIVDTATGKFYMFALIDTSVVPELSTDKFLINETHVPVYEMNSEDLEFSPYPLPGVLHRLNNDGVMVQNALLDYSQFQRAAGAYPATMSPGLVFYLVYLVKIAG